MKRLIQSAVVACSLCSPPGATAADFVPLSDLVTGMTSSAVFDVSNDGGVVVGFYFTPGSANGDDGARAFHWRLGGALTVLTRPTLDPVRGTAFAVNADGSIVLGTDQDRPFLWTEGVGIEYLDFLPGPPTDMSADGSVIVGNNPATSKGYRWSQAD
jgi:uncharacterized membrane protein